MASATRFSLFVLLLIAAVHVASGAAPPALAKNEGAYHNDPQITDQLLQQYESYLVFRYYDNTRPNGANRGGWVDTFSTRYVDRYAEQLWDTLFAKAPEITLFSWSPLASLDVVSARIGHREHLDPECPGAVAECSHGGNARGGGSAHLSCRAGCGAGGPPPAPARTAYRVQVAAHSYAVCAVE